MQRELTPKSDAEPVTGEIEEVHKAIGHFVYEFSRLEDWLRVTLQHLLKIDPDAFISLSAGLDFAFLCNASLAALKEDATRSTDASALQKVIKRCLDINQHRVRAVHGIWIAGMASHTSRTSLAGGEYFAKPAELHKLADESVGLRHRIQKLLK